MEDSPPTTKHLTAAHYLAAVQGELRPDQVRARCRQHLLAVCPACSELPESEATGGEPTNLVRVPPRPTDARALSLEDVQVGRDFLAVGREVHREARVDLAKLLRLPPSSWRRRVERSQTRFRSPPFAALLLAECRARVRTAPHEAALLAELVVPALDRRPGRLELPWAQELALLAEAHRANAMRVGGDLASAAAAFAGLWRRWGSGEPSPGVEAEVLSLEASLAIDQRTTRRAKNLLTKALQRFAAAGAEVGLARAQVKLANLLQAKGRPAEVAPLLAEAARRVEREDDPHLHWCIFQGRLTALLDLDRADDAAALLAEERSAYGDQSDGYTRAAVRFLEGRIFLGQERHEPAVDAFTEARDAMLALDRTYDAVLSSLYLADALLAAGETRRVERLAARLIPMFRERGVARETLASLRLLVEAARSGEVSRALVATVRRQVQSGALL